MNKSDKKWNLIAALIAALIIGVALGENAGWPFLAGPLEKQLSLLINRQVGFYSNDAVNLSKFNTSNNQITNHQINNYVHPKVRLFQINFLGGVTLKTAKLYIAAPTWSTKPYFVYGNNILLKLRYIDIWRAYHDQSIRFRSLQAEQLEVYAERKVDGRASWQFSDKPRDPNNPLKLPIFDQLLVTNGLLHIQDDPLKSNIEAKLSFVSNADTQNSPTLNKNKLTANATGRYNDLPLKIDLVSTGALPTSFNNSTKFPVAMALNATLGRASLQFKGTVKNMMHPNDFTGSFNLKGPSVAAVGDLVGITLPTTADFSSNGSIEKQDLIWRIRLDQLSIGSSQLNGQFSYDKSLAIPLLKGQLAGKLVITDLGPAFGANSEDKKSDKVLPSRPFDLASLHKMNADVMVDLQYLDLKTSFLEPIKPLQAYLQLKNAVITLKNIEGSTGDGRLTGDMGLDGRGSEVIWNTNLAWNGVRLERWVKQKRADGLPPYISGKLNGKALLQGQGNSTSEILASLNGSIRSELVQGSVSHLGIEVAGLDVAQSIGVLFKGDNALPVQCAVVDLQAKNGVFIPRVMVVDTTVTTVWVNGSLSLAAETLNLRVMALPKNFSPLTLRVPLNITGHFANPQVSLEKKPVGLKLVTSVLLAIINPLAAVIPLLDSGNANEAKQRAAGCLNLMQKNRAALSTAK
jgi:uncharacterized protein involved in outer membrane biogenesis